MERSQRFLSGWWELGCLVGVFLLAVNLSFAAEVKAEMVSYHSGNETISGYLALPAGPGPHPGLVVIQEWWGLNDWIKEQARRFASNGYVALAPDLYRGKVATDPALAHELSRGLPDDRALRDLKASFNFLRARKDVKKTAVGSVGWCMGGGLSLKLALNEPDLRACVVNYGALPTDSGTIARINAPVLGNFGAEDQGIPPAAVNAFEKEMKNQKKWIDVKIYDGAGHAFENPNNLQGYREAAARDAWERMIKFLNENLK